MMGSSLEEGETDRAESEHVPGEGTSIRAGVPGDVHLKSDAAIGYRELSALEHGGSGLGKKRVDYP